MQNNANVAQHAKEPVLRPETTVQARPLAAVTKVLFALLIIWCWPVLMYYPDPGGAAEQVWLDRAVNHLRNIAYECEDDPELRDVLCYVIVRYDRVGRLDVAFQSLRWVNTHRVGESANWSRVLGLNNPLLPGFILDPEVVTMNIHEGAGFLVHEALHDYWPYYGHGHIAPIMKRYKNRHWCIWHSKGKHGH